MPLSNTATPKYYGMFRDQVLRGQIPVCEPISLQMNRIDARIKDPRFFYDQESVDAWIEFCENELTLTNGQDLHLLDTFKLWGEDLWGWYEFEPRSVFVPDPSGHGGRYENQMVRKRLTRRQYIIVARGNAKTVYAGCNQGYGLVVDPDTTFQVSTGPTMKQGELTLDSLTTAIQRARGPVFKFMTMGKKHNTRGTQNDKRALDTTKKGIENHLTNSLLTVLPMSIEKLQGWRSKYSTVDEWLSCDIREDPIGALDQGAGKVIDPWIIATSSEGTIRNGIGDTIKQELMDILKGEYENPHVSIWWYKMDDISEIANPNLWVKACPNLGKTIQYSEYQDEVERMEKNPSARNDILAKRFGIPVEGYTYFFTYEETLPHRPKSYYGMPCAMGCDLSQGDDFCAFTFLFPLKNGKFGVKTRSYITTRTFNLLPYAARLKYEEFLRENSLVIMEGTILDMMQVYDDLDRFIISQDYDVRCLGYDPYNAVEFVERWARENGGFGIEKVIQGAKTESVPLGEIKKLSEDRVLLFDEALMSYAMGNCIVLEDTNGNRKLYKRRRDQKIDNVAALMDAFIAFKINKEIFD